MTLSPQWKSTGLVRTLRNPVLGRTDRCSVLVLNIHGEVLESLAPADTTLEEAFLPTLKQLHDRFPQLRIVVRLPYSRSGW
jgi:dihydroorotase